MINKLSSVFFVYLVGRQSLKTFFIAQSLSFSRCKCSNFFLHGDHFLFFYDFVTIHSVRAHCLSTTWKTKLASLLSACSQWCIPPSAGREGRFQATVMRGWCEVDARRMRRGLPFCANYQRFSCCALCFVALSCCVLIDFEQMSGQFVLAADSTDAPTFPLMCRGVQ